MLQLYTIRFLKHFQIRSSERVASGSADLTRTLSAQLFLIALGGAGACCYMLFVARTSVDLAKGLQVVQLRKLLGFLILVDCSGCTCGG
jgi:hypothetical protein